MKTKKYLTALFLFLIISIFDVHSQNKIQYGSNFENGKFILLNNVKHYYETYGEGKPLLLIHGNSTGIKGWAPQIEFFSKSYKVYAIDCRGRGNSEMGKDSLSYIQQAKDMAAFIEELKLDSVDIIGKSDGGIIALLMAINFPNHINRIVSFSANLEPDTSAMYPESVLEIHEKRMEAEKMIAAKDTSQNWELIRQRNRMMEFQPHVSAEGLHKIEVPVLIVSTDRDVVKEEHTFWIYKNIANANLSIISGESHHVVRQNPDAFNAVAIKFLTEPIRTSKYRFEN